MEENKTNEKSYTFSDVYIKPGYSEIGSRKKDVDLTSDFGFFKLELPIIAANMKTICGPKMAIAMAENGGMGALHRFGSIDQAVRDFLEVKNHFENEVLDGESYSVGNSNAYFQVDNKISETSGGGSISSTFKPVCKRDFVVGVSIGVQEEDKERFDKLYEASAKIFFIDIAHGHSLGMKNMLGWIKSINLKDIYVIAGNVATSEGAYDLVMWGADCVKVGIGPGSACLTRKNTGVGVPQLYALQEVNEEFRKQGIKAKIIADGGMSVRGDIPKGMKYSNAAMLGLMLAGTTETPGKVFTDESGELYKVYAGSASGESKVSNGDANEFVEGVAKTVRFRGHVEHILRYIKEGLQSAYSYVGAKNTPEFQEKCEFGKMTNGGKIESKI